jgi:hypothetical protein
MGYKSSVFFFVAAWVLQVVQSNGRPLRLVIAADCIWSSWMMLTDVLSCQYNSSRPVLFVCLTTFCIVSVTNTSCLILCVSRFTVNKCIIVPVLDSASRLEGIWRSGVRRWWLIGFTLRPVLPLGEERTLTDRIGSWMGPRAGVKALEEKILPLPATEARFFSRLGLISVIVLTELYWLSLCINSNTLFGV